MKMQLVTYTYGQVETQHYLFHNSDNAFRRYHELVIEHQSGIGIEEVGSVDFYLSNKDEMDALISEVITAQIYSNHEVRWYEVEPEDVSDAENVLPDFVTAHDAPICANCAEDISGTVHTIDVEPQGEQHLCGGCMYAILKAQGQ